MLRRLIPLALTTAVAAASLPLLAAPAHADRATVADATRDVVDGDDEPAEPGSDAEPKADIVRSTLVHGADRIRITVEVRNLRARSLIDEKPDAYSYLRTSERGKFSIEETEGPDGQNLLVRDERSEETCLGKTYQVPAKNIIVQSFPRDCVGDPEWVRFGLFVLAQRVDDSFGAYDDARRTGGPAQFPPAIGGPRIAARS